MAASSCNALFGKFAHKACRSAARAGTGPVLVAALVLAQAILPAGPALAFDPYHHPKRDLPSCTDEAVAGRVMENFNWAEKNTWHRGFSLEKMYRRHEHRTRNWPGSPITRRYCMATGLMTNGRKRSVYYLIEEHNGFAGRDWGVTYCISGLDPWRYRDGHCRTVR